MGILTTDTNQKWRWMNENWKYGCKNLWNCEKVQRIIQTWLQH